MSNYYTTVLTHLYHYIYRKSFTYAIMSIVLPSIQSFKTFSRSETLEGQIMEYYGLSGSKLRFFIQERESTNKFDGEIFSLCTETECKSLICLQWRCIKLLWWFWRNYITNRRSENMPTCQLQLEQNRKNSMNNWTTDDDELIDISMQGVQVEHHIWYVIKDYND